MGQGQRVQGLFGDLGVQLPPKLGEIDPIKQRLAEEAAIKAAQEQPAYKRAIMGMLGLGVPRQEGEPINVGNASGFLGELFGTAPVESIAAIKALGGAKLAGLPFAAYAHKLLGGKLFHGSPAVNKIVEQGFDTSKYNTTDILGNWTHAAEEPHYAEGFADKGAYGGAKGILPVKLEANNVLDLYNLTPEDRAKVANILRKKYGYLDRDWTDSVDPDALTSPIKGLTPEELGREGFDAVRYSDYGKRAWAAPAEKVIGAYTGAPIGVAKPKPSKFADKYAVLDDNGHVTHVFTEQEYAMKAAKSLGLKYDKIKEAGNGVYYGVDSGLDLTNLGNIKIQDLGQVKSGYSSLTEKPAPVYGSPEEALEWKAKDTHPYEVYNKEGKFLDHFKTDKAALHFIQTYPDDMQSAMSVKGPKGHPGVTGKVIGGIGHDPASGLYNVHNPITKQMEYFSNFEDAKNSIGFTKSPYAGKFEIFDSVKGTTHTLVNSQDEALDYIKSHKNSYSSLDYQQIGDDGLGVLNKEAPGDYGWLNPASNLSMQGIMPTKPKTMGTKLAEAVAKDKALKAKPLATQDITPFSEGNILKKTPVNIGNSHPAEIHEDVPSSAKSEGLKWLYKPDPTGISPAAESVASKLATLIHPDRAIQVKLVPGGSKQLLLGGRTNHQKIDLDNLTPQLITDLQTEQVLDWLIGNHDSSADNLIVAGGKLYPIDKGQAFKFYGKDKLDPTYQPNTYSQPPIYNEMWKKAVNGEINMDFGDLSDLIPVIQQRINNALHKTDLANNLMDYADKVGIDPAKFMDMFQSRLDNLYNDFEAYYNRLAQEQGF